MAYVIAVDLGGTLTKIGAATPDGRVHDVTRVATGRDPDGVVSLDWLAGTLSTAIAQRSDPCAGFAVMVPGVIDVAAQVVRAAANTGWYDLPLAERLTEDLGRPGVIGHDVRAGGLAEWRLGSGAGADQLLFLALGTGIAGAAMVDGRMLLADGYAGEVGHVRTTAGGDRDCACGLVGCLETVASASGLARSYARLTGLTALGPEIAGLARFGDQAAQQAFALANLALEEVLAAYVAIAAPEVVVLGGGLAGAADLMLPALRDGLEDRLSFHRRPRLVSAALGSDAGLIGAGLIGWEALPS